MVSNRPIENDGTVAGIPLPPWKHRHGQHRTRPPIKRYRLRFRFAGRGCKRSLGTTSKREAIAAQVRFEETLRLVESRHLTIPPDSDPISFLLSDGRVTGTKPLKLVMLGQLIDSYQQELPPGAREDSTLYTKGIQP